MIVVFVYVFRLLWTVAGKGVGFMMKKIFIAIVTCCLSFNFISITDAGFSFEKLVKNVVKDISKDKQLRKDILKKVHIAPTTRIYADGNYNNGQINYLVGKEDFKTEYHKYKMYLDSPATIKLHFISHVDDYIEFKLVDFDENSIRPFEKRLDINRSPFTKTVTLDKGEYTFIVYKIRSLNSHSNTGSYRFKFEKIAYD